MKGVFYRLKGRKNNLIKNCVIMGLLIIIASLALILPQLINPHILREHLDGMDGTINLSIDGAKRYDVELTGKTRDPGFLNNFSQMVEKASKEVYKTYQPKDIQLITRFSPIQILNQSDSNRTDTRIVILGVTNELYDTIRNYAANNFTDTGPIILREKQNESIGGWYGLDLWGENVTITFDKELGYETFDNYLPILSYYLIPRISISYSFFNITKFPCLIYKINEFLTTFNETFIENNIHSSYSLMGYLKFEEIQRDIMFWTIDAETKLNYFEKKLQSLIQLESETTEFEFLNARFTGRVELLYIIYLFIRGLQIVIWGGVLFFAIIFVVKTQKKEREKEQRILLSGQKWVLRLGNLFMENLTVIGGGTLIASIALYPLTKMQLLFEMSLMLNFSTILECGIIVIILFIITFGAYVDYELFLRRRIYKQIEEEEYKPFNRLPKSLWIVPIGLIVLLMWVLNKNIFFLIAFIAFVLIALLICFITITIIKAISNFGKWVYYKRQRKQDKTTSPIFMLSKLMKKKINSKLFLYSFMVTIICLAFFYANFNADAQRTQLLWSNGSLIQIEGTTSMNTTGVEQTILKMPEIRDTIKKIQIQVFGNETDDYSFCFINGTITPVNRSSVIVSKLIYLIIGMNGSDYGKFYEQWKQESWLEGADFSDLEKDSIFISKKFRDFDYNIGDSLNLFNSSMTMSIKGVINTLPDITDALGTMSEEHLFIIMDLEQLQMLFDEKGWEHRIRYNIHVEEKDIETVIDEINLKMTLYKISNIRYLPQTVFKGIRIVFLKPVVLVAELFILFWGVLFIYSNIEDINQSIDAKNLGMIAFSKNISRPLKRFKLMEGGILIAAFLIIFGMLYGFTLLYLLAFEYMSELQAIIISKETILNILFIVLAYPTLVLLQGIIEYYHLKKVDISLVYRHPE